VKGRVRITVAASCCAALAMASFPATSAAQRSTTRAGKVPAGQGRGAIVQMDPSFGTVRMIARLDGMLTGPSGDTPRRIALRYVRRNLAALGLTAADVDTLAFRRDYVDVLGTHHLSWTQRIGRLVAFQVGLEASVTADGRLAAISGPVAPGLAAQAGRFEIGRDDALATARTAASAPARVARNDLDSAERIVFPLPDGGARLAWKTRVFASPERVDLTVVDGRTGRVLWRRNTVVGADQVGSGLAWPYYPSQTIPNGGGVQTPVTFPVADATALSGNFAHVFHDFHGTFRNPPPPGSEVPAVDAGALSWTSPAALVSERPVQNCTPDWNCTWNSKVPYSWLRNSTASATNSYWLLNRFHDHLESNPIGFTEAAGNFELVNEDGQGGLDGDPVIAASMLGADGRRGFPDFVNNAFIVPTADGESPYIGLFLFRKEDYGPRVPFGPGFPTSDAGVDAMIVYHEYTHGLSHRLVTTADGEPALWSFQSGSMGEAWSDWYALDLLDAEGYAGDGPGVDLPVGEYITGGDGIRFQFADCRVDSEAADCPEPRRADDGVGPGGFTYGDLGHIAGFPEVHTDGEIWLQTLWELRDTLGSVATQRLVTRAMELSPPNPSFLDMRNAILVADTIASAGANHADIWNVFAGRGMGYFAETNGKVRVVEDFSLPVTCPGVGCGRVQGRIVDADTGEPVVGATVTLAGAATGIPVQLGATTGADGTYTIDDVPNHRYPHVHVSSPGYLPRSIRQVDVSGTRVLDAAVVRNWAQLDGGTTITRAVSGGAVSDLCPVELALDGDQGTRWQTTKRVGGRPASVTLRFPQAVDLRSIAIDPSPCMRHGTYRLRAFTFFTRQDGGAWFKAIVNDGSLPRHRLVHFDIGKGRRDVTQVRLVLRRSEPGAPSEIGIAEFRVRGSPA
jgi:extracellular elastinolytic metalloproteinase